MKQKIILWISFSLSIVFGVLLFGQFLFRSAPNLLRNGGFDEGLEKWRCYVDKKSGAKASFSIENATGATGPAAKISIETAADFDHIELSQGNVALKAGRQYRLTFRARSNVPQIIELKMIKNQDPWTPYGFQRTANLKTTWQKFKLTDRATATANDGKMMVHFNTPESEVWIDDIRFTEGSGIF